MFEPYEEDLELKIPEKEECRFVSHPKVLKVIIPLGEILVSRTALYSQSFLVNKLYRWDGKYENSAYAV